MPVTMYNVNEVIERFNTLEQPRIEDILDSVDDNLEESREILEQVRKLFVVKRKVPMVVETLPRLDRERFEWLGKAVTALESGVTKEFELSDKFRTIAGKVRPVLEIAEAINP
ncbi:MAG: hypothetical protein QXF24_02405 [Thermoproteota archaeon]